MSLARALADGVSALRAGRWADAAAQLERVVADPDLAAADDLVDLRARACSLYAQALLEDGRPREAEAPCREAIRLLRRLRDAAGLQEVRALQDRIVGAIAHDAHHEARRAEQRRVADQPLDALLADAHTPEARAEVRVKKAQAHLDVGEPDVAAALAREAVAEADVGADVSWRVLARLVLAQSRPDEAADPVVAAYRVAERAGEFNLVSTVAQTARSLGVALPVEPGPHRPTNES